MFMVQPPLNMNRCKQVQQVNRCLKIVHIKYISNKNLHKVHFILNSIKFN